jgi:pimeloyl-ACP methyl ester carboxylesterase
MPRARSGDGTTFGWILTFGGGISKNIFRASCVKFLPSRGTDDGYGTMAKVQAIKRQSSGSVELVALAECRHSPQRDHTDAVLAAIAGLVKRIGGNKSEAGGV